MLVGFLKPDKRGEAGRACGFLDWERAAVEGDAEDTPGLVIELEGLELAGFFATGIPDALFLAADACVCLSLVRFNNSSFRSFSTCSWRFLRSSAAAFRSASRTLDNSNCFIRSACFCSRI
jgi:hypothetical protein